MAGISHAGPFGAVMALTLGRENAGSSSGRFERSGFAKGTVSVLKALHREDRSARPPPRRTHLSNCERWGTRKSIARVDGSGHPATREKPKSAAPQEGYRENPHP